MTPNLFAGVLSAKLSSELITFKPTNQEVIAPKIKAKMFLRAARAQRGYNKKREKVYIK